MIIVLSPDTRRRQYYAEYFSHHNILSLVCNRSTFLSVLIQLLKLRLRERLYILDIGGVFLPFSVIFRTTVLINNFPFFEWNHSFGHYYADDAPSKKLYRYKRFRYLLLELLSYKIAIQSQDLSSRLLFRKLKGIIPHSLESCDSIDTINYEEVALAGQICLPKGLEYVGELKKHFKSITLYGSFYPPDLIRPEVNMIDRVEKSDSWAEDCQCIFFHLSSFDSSARVVFEALSDGLIVVVMDHPGLRHAYGHPHLWVVKNISDVGDLPLKDFVFNKYKCSQFVKIYEKQRKCKSQFWLWK